MPIEVVIGAGVSADGVDAKGRLAVHGGVPEDLPGPRVVDDLHARERSGSPRLRRRASAGPMARAADAASAPPARLPRRASHFMVAPNFATAIFQAPRSATIGSTAVARRAGTKHAAPRPRPRARAATDEVRRRVRRATPRRAGSPRAASGAIAPARPRASPASTGRIPCPRTIRCTLDGSAPRAMRMPNSRRRWPTENAMTPAMPVAVMIRARPAKARQQDRGQARRGERAGVHLLERAEVVHRLLGPDRVHGRAHRRAPSAAGRTPCAARHVVERPGNCGRER